ncbi:hypothetical protein [Halovenus marina]
MASEQWLIAPVRSWWRDLERDWQSVVVGAVIVTLSAIPEMGIPL